MRSLSYLNYFLFIFVYYFVAVQLHCTLYIFRCFRKKPILSYLILSYHLLQVVHQCASDTEDRRCAYERVHQADGWLADEQTVQPLTMTSLTL